LWQCLTTTTDQNQVDKRYSSSDPSEVILIFPEEIEQPEQPERKLTLTILHSLKSGKHLNLTKVHLAMQ